MTTTSKPDGFINQENFAAAGNGSSFFPKTGAFNVTLTGDTGSVKLTRKLPGQSAFHLIETYSTVPSTDMIPEVEPGAEYRFECASTTGTTVARASQ